MNAQSAFLSILALVLGAAIGFVHYRALHSVVQHFMAGQTVAAIGLQIGRLVLVLGALIAAVWLGAMPLLACFGGILIGRWIVLRQTREDA